MIDSLVHAGTVEELERLGRKVVKTHRAPVLVLHHDGRFTAIDNRCPHMGFPLHQGDVHDGLLDCHWHHARYDISCGKTLDPWADDADSYRVVVEDGHVYVDPDLPSRDPREHGLERLRRGLEDRLRLVVAKSVVELQEGGVDLHEAVLAGLRFGSRERERGWDVGLSILSAMTNTLPALDVEDRARALVHSLSRVSRDAANEPPRRPLPPLEGTERDLEGLIAWFRETVEVRDSDGSERILGAIVRTHGRVAALDAVLRACTDHRYCDGGHTLDYAVKCAELVESLGDRADEEDVELAFTSLVPQLVQMQRMEERSSWRRPVDVAGIVARVAEGLPAEPFASPDDDGPLADEDALVERLLGEDPAASADELRARLDAGASPVALADAVVTAAVRRVLQFGRANELSDWDTVHHTLTYANAVAEGMRRAPSPELFRAVLDGAMSVYLDRFLNIPPARLPEADREHASSVADLHAIYDGRGAVDEAARCAASALAGGVSPDELLAGLGHAVLREDANFHEFQQLEIAWRRTRRRGDHDSTRLALVATARWIAAQYPTRRGVEQTFDIARRLHRGDELFSAE